MASYDQTDFRNKFGNLQVDKTLIVFGDIDLRNNASVSLNGGRITGGAAPVSPDDLTTKRYVDIACGGLDYKESVRVASVANITGFLYANKLDIENSLDTVSATPIVLEVGQRVLVKDQIDLTRNGIYIWDRYSGLVRSEDSDGSHENEVSGGNICFIEEGDLHASTGWMIVGKGVKVIGTDNIEWTRIAGPGTGGVSYLNDLLDVGITSAANRDGLVYISGINQWQNKSNAGSYYQVGAPSDAPFSIDVGIFTSDTITNALQKLDVYVTNGLVSTSDLAGIVSDIADLRSDLVLVTSDIADLRSDVVFVMSDIADLRSDVAQNTSDIASLNIIVTDITSDIADLRSDVVFVMSDVVDLRSDVVQNTSDIASLNIIVTDITSDIADLISDVAQNTSDIAGLSGSGISENVVLVDNSSSQVNITNTDLRGSFILLVKSATNPGASSVFAATSGSASNAGTIARLVNAPSTTDEEISAIWPASDYIKLYHSVLKTGGSGANINYSVKIFSV